MPRAFADTNVIIYAVSNDPVRAPIAQKLMRSGPLISVQVMNEFMNVARRKLRWTWPDCRRALDTLTLTCPDPLPVTLKCHNAAVDIAERHGLAVHDAVLLGTALGANCVTFWSEDMQDGMVIGGRLTIRNPFV